MLRTDTPHRFLKFLWLLLIISSKAYKMKFRLKLTIPCFIRTLLLGFHNTQVASSCSGLRSEENMDLLVSTPYSSLRSGDFLME